MHKLSYVIGLLQGAMQEHGDIAFMIEGSGPMSDLECDGSILLHDITGLEHYPDVECPCLAMVMKKHGYAPGA